jgi:uncharacterized circularly permuted ATP-grasp superfamily protein
MKFAGYQTEGFFDEMFQATGAPRDGAKMLVQKLDSLDDGELLERQAAAEQALLRMGITFNVYGDKSGTERIFPFDVIPRIVEANEWTTIAQGLRQRVFALNIFINDIYHDQKIINDGVVPRELVESASSFRKQCVGLNPPQGIWCHVTGTDLVRHDDGVWYARS